jgi:3-oxoacyl-[acyl-carrier protein] reductase
VKRYIDRVVMVTGAGQGLGQAMAERFAEEGAHLAISDLRADTVKEVADLISGRCQTWITATAVDVTDRTQVDSWVTDTVAAFGRIDVLVNNAGVIRDGRLEQMSDDNWQTVIDVNLRGMFHCCRAVFPQMKQQRYGRILSFSSMSWRGNFGQANYAAAKAGVVGMARTIALEGAPFGITSNIIAPGLIDTPMLASMNPAAREKLAGRIPVKRIGHPEEIAEAAGYLCSAPAAYVTGVVLDVDGGIGIGSALR